MPRNIRIAALLVLAALLAPASPAHAAPANDDFTGRAADARRVGHDGHHDRDVRARRAGTVVLGVPRREPCRLVPLRRHRSRRRGSRHRRLVVRVTRRRHRAGGLRRRRPRVAGRGRLQRRLRPRLPSANGMGHLPGQTYYPLAGGWDATEVGTLALSLDAAPALSGVTLVAAGGMPAAGVAVDLFDEAGYLLRCAVTGASGANSGVRCRVPGQHRLRASQPADDAIGDRLERGDVRRVLPHCQAPVPQRGDQRRHRGGVGVGVADEDVVVGQPLRRVPMVRARAGSAQLPGLNTIVQRTKTRNTSSIDATRARRSVMPTTAGSSPPRSAAMPSALPVWGP